INGSLKPYEDDEYASQVNIPFTHSSYSRFDRSMNIVGTNSHTAAKPFVYADVSKYHDFAKENEALLKGTDSWWSRKLWNEHLVQLKGKDYWFTIDPIFDFSVGKNTDSDHDGTFTNTRGVYIQGGLGKKLNFSASIFESQGRFPDYFNQFAESLKPFGPDPGVIPGRGIAKRFKKDSYDFPVAEGYLSYAPADFLNIQFGHGKNFIGDGYRSLLMSDNASPYPFLKLNTKFWKIKYTNTWMWLRDLRPEVTEDGAFLTKYMANHYLSWNVSKRFNLGLFESVMWTNTNDRGFDINYLNPVIFYRAIEFATGPDAGNAIIGLSSKFKWNDQVNLYGQFILDEFSLNDVKAGNKSWKNKFGFQLGAKYYNAFDVKNLLLQFEYNQVRPYTYSHNSIVLNYAHNYQSMAHLWNSNFREAILIGRYNYKRWSADAKIVVGVKGFDFNTVDDMANYGGDIFADERERPSDSGIEIGQGIKTNIFHAEVQASYLLNPKTNLKVFTYLSYRDFDPEAQTAEVISNNTLWFNLGLRTDLFNWYFDF
ncbi:MAG: gliding motility protein RemB, partial [Flavobacteriaceae bacterium]|nr:gliding motility protein RemB [Flavobacteriaceae bacterium]